MKENSAPIRDYILCKLIKLKVVKMLNQAHLFVMEFNYKENQIDTMENVYGSPMFSEVFLNDESDIDELTEIDEWHIPKSVSIKLLSSGWHCYVLKVDNKIAATGWATQDNIFFDTYLKREFSLGDNESYFWRGHCVPFYRSRGLTQYLSTAMVKDLNNKHEKNKFLTLVRIDNEKIIRTMKNVGWTIIGRAGFIDISWLRFHYLFGKNSFFYTKKRSYFQWNK